MTATPNPSHDWTECPPGEISHLVDHLKSQRRQKTYRQAAGVTSGILLLVFATVGLLAGWFPGQGEVPEIACPKVHELAPQYVKGRTDEAVTEQIDRHLEDCPACREHFRAAYPRFPLPPQALSRWTDASPALAQARDWPKPR